MSLPAAGSVLFGKLDHAGCVRLLSTQRVGRIGWASDAGQIILPVSYVYVDGVVGFRTAADGPLADLIRPTAVAFEVDQLDPVHQTGSCVLVQGVTHAAGDGQGIRPRWATEVVPWAGGRRQLPIEIRISQLSGRAIQRS